MSSSSSLPSVAGRFSMHRSRTLTNLEPRVLCRFGTECRRTNPKHFEEEAHPADDDYLFCCKQAKVQPKFISVYMLFKWCDMDGSGRARREELAEVWTSVQACGEGIGELTDELWKTLDDDGNDFVSFSEFAEFTTKYRVSLPLGLDSLLGDKGSKAGQFRCGVPDCPCMEFVVRRTRCKYGDQCYQRSKEHQKGFCHPCDNDWDKCTTVRDDNMCRCGHKRKLHSSAMTCAGAVQYPRYWTSTAKGDEEFNQFVRTDSEMLVHIQHLCDKTYDDITTRDRLRHSGSWMVPSGFEVITAERNENSKLWRKYTVKKAELQQERTHTSDEDDAPYLVVNDVKSTEAWEASHGEALEEQINEWYLWHGTSASAARNICSTDFKMRLAGSATGTLYGKGTYLAESFTKADEYAKLENGSYTLLLCRVLGGRVRQCLEREPDADQLTKDCVEGMYDCVVGDRRKISGTYREFITFDAENIYPEFIVSYKRGEVFKSRSHP